MKGHRGHWRCLGRSLGSGGGLQMPALPMRTTMESTNNDTASASQAKGDLDNEESEDTPLLVSAKESLYPRQERDGMSSQCQESWHATEEN